MNDFLLSLLIGACFSGLIGSALGGLRHNRGRGFFWGFCFGPLGWIITLLLPPGIPFGKEAAKCRWCGRPVVGNQTQCGCGKLYSDPGPTQQVRDPLEEWEMQERVKQGPLPPPPGWKRDQPLE